MILKWGLHSHFWIQFKVKFIQIQTSSSVRGRMSTVRVVQRMLRGFTFTSGHPSTSAYANTHIRIQILDSKVETALGASAGPSGLYSCVVWKWKRCSDPVHGILSSGRSCEGPLAPFCPSICPGHEQGVPSHQWIGHLCSVSFDLQIYWSTDLLIYWSTDLLIVSWLVSQTRSSVFATVLRIYRAYDVVSHFPANVPIVSRSFIEMNKNTVGHTTWSSRIMAVHASQDLLILCHFGFKL